MPMIHVIPLDTANLAAVPVGADARLGTASVVLPVTLLTTDGNADFSVRLTGMLKAGANASVQVALATLDQDGHPLLLPGTRLQTAQPTFHSMRSDAWVAVATQEAYLRLAVIGSSTGANPGAISGLTLLLRVGAGLGRRD